MKKWWADFILLVKTFSKYRLRKQFRKPFQLIGISLLLVIVISFVYSPVSNYYRELTHPKAYGRVKVDWYKDYNSEHLKFAKKNGIQPFKNSKALHEGIGKLLKENQLEKVKNTKYYRLKGLTHSHPYLTPIAVQLLEDIGKRFRKKLDENNLDTYVFSVSSLLRTQESQKGLSRINRNASPNTSHLYGTTFDIAYKNVVRKPLPWMKVEVADARAIKLLSEAIGELRKEGRCKVVTEKHETCFHITVVK